MKRLEQLAAKENLNNAEMAEASTLISSLQGKYGDLGLAINKATGEIEGMREAQISLMDVMREQAIGQLEREKREARSNWLAKRKEARGFRDTFTGSHGIGDWFFGAKEELSGLNIEALTSRSTGESGDSKAVTKTH